MTPVQHITSTDSKQTPAIDSCYHDEDIDLDIMVEGVKFIRQVVQTEPFSALVAEEVLPGPDVRTDDEIYGTKPLSPSAREYSDMKIYRLRAKRHHIFVA